MVRPQNFLKDCLYYNQFSVAFCVLYALATGILLMADYKLGVVIAILPLLAFVLINDKKNGLYILLAFTSLQEAPFLYYNLLNLPGAKPFNLIAFLTLLVCLYFNGKFLFQPGTFRRKVMVYFWIYFAFYSVAALRSINYLHLLHMFEPEKFEISRISYLFSFYIKPSLYLVSFIYILNHITSEKDIERIISFLCIILGLISILLISITLSHSTMSMSRDNLNILWGDYLGLHYNTLGSFYIVMGPFIIVKAINKRFWSVINWCLALVALAILQSRSSILVFLFANVLMLYFLRKKKELIILCSIFALITVYYLPGFLINTFKIGLESGNLDRIFTGRIDNIWIPLLTEWFANIKLLLFGRGLFSMMTSQAYLKGVVLQTSVAHNAFIEFFLDNGIILFLIMIFYIFKLLKLAWYNVKAINSDVGWALFVSIICYFIGTISGRSIYPTPQNMFLFPIIALMVNYLRCKNEAFN